MEMRRLPLAGKSHSSLRNDVAGAVAGGGARDVGGGSLVAQAAEGEVELIGRIDAWFRRDGIHAESFGRDEAGDMLALAGGWPSTDGGD